MSKLRKNELIFSPDLIRLLTDLLYPEPKMAVREILANAADALLVGKDLISKQEEQPYILITPNRTEPPTLTIEDNGVGLKPEEAHVLNTVGCDERKRKGFEENLAGSGLGASDIKEKLIGLIGRYGIGRLACLCIAKKVIIESKSRDGGSGGIEWTLEEGKTETTLRSIIKDDPGTK